MKPSDMLRPDGSLMLQCCSYCALFFLAENVMGTLRHHVVASVCGIVAQLRNISKQNCI